METKDLRQIQLHTLFFLIMFASFNHNDTSLKLSHIQCCVGLKKTFRDPLGLGFGSLGLRYQF
jgi:hypothetical protein